MGINSPEELLELLKQSRLLSAEQLDDVHDSMLLTHDVSQLLDMLVEREVLTEWQKTQLLAGRTGFFIGNYVLLGLLGRGGMGSVFLGRHTTMNRYCAVKVVSKKVGKDPDSLDQFLTEARAIASLDHPNIVQAYDVDKENDHFYIVMEYVEGQSLEEIVNQEGILDCESAVDCIRQAAEGLAHAHSRNMVHCDIKPSNLLVNEQGVVKILDMGMARLVGDSAVSDSNSDSRNTDRILGTVDYMAPEQAVSAPSFDFRADIYSLGCTLFALLVGHPPFNEGTLTQRILKHQTQVPPSLRRFRQDVPVDLAEICMKMMAKDPNDRYHSSEELAEVLAKWTMPQEPITPQQVESEPPSLPGSDSFADEAFGSGEATAGPAIGSRRLKKQGFWENDRLLLSLLTGLIVVAVGVLLFLIIASTQSGDPPSKPDKPSGVVPPTKIDSGKNGSDLSTHGSGQDGTVSTTTPRNFLLQPPSMPYKPEEHLNETADPLAPPATKPATENPFTRLPQAVDLLSIGESSNTIRELPLGNLLFDKNGKGAKSIELDLIGGDIVLDQHKFTIPKVVSGDGLPKWLVQLTSSKTQVNVAEIWIDKDNDLMFRWLNVDADVSAGYLSLCILKITADEHTHRMKLSNPKIIDPWKIIPIKKIISYDVKPNIFPNKSLLQIKLLDYVGPYKKIRYTPSDILKTDGKKVAVTLTGNGLPTLTIKFEFFVQGQVARLRAEGSYSLKLAQGARQIKIPWNNVKAIYWRANNLDTLEAKEQERVTKLWEIIANEIKQAKKPSRNSEESQGLGIIQFKEYIKTGDFNIELLKTKPTPKIK